MRRDVAEREFNRLGQRIASADRNAVGAVIAEIGYGETHGRDFGSSLSRGFRRHSGTLAQSTIAPTISAMKDPDRGLTGAASAFAVTAVAVWLVHRVLLSGMDWLKYVWTSLLGLGVLLVLAWYGWRIRQRRG